MLTDLIQKSDKFQEIKSRLTKPGQIINGLVNPAKSVIISNLASNTSQPIVFVTQNHHEALTYYREIKNLNPQKQVFNFLSHEVSAYDQINSDSSIISSQMQVFESWQKKESSITIINFKAFLQQYINFQTYQTRTIKIDKSLEQDPQKLAKDLVLLGYTKVPAVENKGQFSQRGDITDIYPLVGEPVRIEFFGDNIESIRIFNLNTQRSIKETDSCTIHPRFSLVREENDKLKENILETYGADEHLIEHLKESEDLYWEGVEYYREFTKQTASNFFEFLPSNCHLIFDEWQDLFNQIDQFLEKQDEICEDARTKNKILQLEKSLYFTSKDIKTNLENIKFKLYLQTLSEEEENLSYEIKSYPTERFSSKIADFVEYIKQQQRNNKTVLIYSEQPQRVLGIMKEWDIPATYSSQEDDISTTLNNINQKNVYIHQNYLSNT